MENGNNSIDEVQFEQKSLLKVNDKSIECSERNGTFCINTTHIDRLDNACRVSYSFIMLIPWFLERQPSFFQFNRQMF